MSDFPETGDIIVCKIIKVLDYGVFVDLIEFEGLTGFIHISQVSSSWIKNIRNFVKENQIRAAQVISVDFQKKQLDLSFNRVSAGKQRLKIEEFKQTKRTQKLLELLAKQNKVDFGVVQKEIEIPLLERFDSLYDAFQELLVNKTEVLNALPKKWREPLAIIVEKNIEVPKKTVKGLISLSSDAPDGIELIKTALVSAKKESKDADLKIYYVGGGKYMVKVTSFDYKVAERVMRQISEAAIESIETVKGTGSFERLN